MKSPILALLIFLNLGCFGCSTLKMPVPEDTDFNSKYGKEMVKTMENDVGTETLKKWDKYVSEKIYLIEFVKR